MDKYIHKGDGAIVHCPKCRGVIIKHVKVDGDGKETSFATVCPHCRKRLLLRMVLDTFKKEPIITVEERS